MLLQISSDASQIHEAYIAVIAKDSYILSLAI